MSNFPWLTLQTDQLGRITNDLDTIQFSIKKASKLVKEISRQVCHDPYSLILQPILVVFAAQSLLEIHLGLKELVLMLVDY